MKHKLPMRNRILREGDFWSEGMPLTANDRALLQLLIEKAAELGYTPTISEVPNAGKIKKRFRCWKDAVSAAGLPSMREPEQIQRRMERK